MYRTHLTEPFHFTTSLSYLVMLTFLTIRQLFTFVTCRLIRWSAFARRRRLTLIYSFPNFGCDIFTVRKRSNENGLPYLKTNTKDHSPCLRLAMPTFRSFFYWQRQFITDKILLLQQMLSANFWWVFRLERFKLETRKTMLARASIFGLWKYHHHIWSHSARVSNRTTNSIHFSMFRRTYFFLTCLLLFIFALVQIQVDNFVHPQHIIIKIRFSISRKWIETVV